MSDLVLVTGGAGYVGASLVEQLRANDRPVRVFDVFLHGQDGVGARLGELGAELQEGDIRDEAARRVALEDVDAIVHLAAIVGDPACARDPELAQAVNVDSTRALADEARAAGVKHLVFASTCSNYGRMADPTVAVDETAELAPVSLYAEQKVAIERRLLAREQPVT